METQIPVFYIIALSFVLIFQVEENICKFAKKGLTPSQIGVILRDSHGIAQVKSVTGSKILRVLKAHGACFPNAILLCCPIFEEKCLN
jgi:hypothetical protein